MLLERSDPWAQSCSSRVSCCKLTRAGQEATGYEPNSQISDTRLGARFPYAVALCKDWGILSQEATQSKKPSRRFGVVMAVTMTLLALIIGFSFSMASSRYDQRKNLEESEANAIGTEYVRELFARRRCGKTP